MNYTKPFAIVFFLMLDKMDYKCTNSLGIAVNEITIRYRKLLPKSISAEIRACPPKALLSASPARLRQSGGSAFYIFELLLNFSPLSFKAIRGFLLKLHVP